MFKFLQTYQAKLALNLFGLKKAIIKGSCFESLWLEKDIKRLRC